MHAVLGTELRDRQLAPDRLECYFRFEFSVVTLACRLGHLYSSFPKDEPSLSYCPILRDPLYATRATTPQSAATTAIFLVTVVLPFLPFTCVRDSPPSA